MKTTRRAFLEDGLGILVAALCLDAIAPPAKAEDAVGRLETLRNLQQRERQDESRWRTQHQALLENVAIASRAIDAAADAYSKSRRRRRHRGGGVPAWVLEQRVQAEDALVKAERALAAFREEASRASVPPGWLRD